MELRFLFATATCKAMQCRVPFSRLSGFSELFQTYCADYGRLADWYAGDWRTLDAYRDVASRVDARSLPRDTIADLLERQHGVWGCTDAQRHNIALLRSPETLAVVTGQQVGIFGGPLYTLYKALTAVALAAHLRRALGRAVVPVFWLEGGDHDLQEVAQTYLIQGGAVVQGRYQGHAPPEHGNLGSVGRLRFTRDIERVKEELMAAMPPSEFRQRAEEQWLAAYRQGATFLGAFAVSMSQLFGDTGLLFLDPESAEAKRLAAPVFSREIQSCATSYALLEEASRSLDRDYHAQVRPRATNLFVTGEAGREAILPDRDSFVLRYSGQHYSGDALLQWIAETPERFSPNVALRPVVQDWLLPTVAYVAGPGEVAYFAQIKGLYDAFGVPMPVVHPRASLTIVEARVQKALQRAGLEMADMGHDLERIFQRVVLNESDIDSVFAAASPPIDTAIANMKPAIERVDPTLGRSVEATRALIRKELGKLKGRAVRAEKRKQETLYNMLAKAQAHLYPAGKPQERVLSPLYFFSRYGSKFFDTLGATVSLDTSEHQVLFL